MSEVILDHVRRERRVIARALRLGLIIKPKSCPRCRLRHRPPEIVGELVSISPLRVSWLCKTCHRRQYSTVVPEGVPRTSARLRRIRETASISQKELARRSGLSQQTVSRVETGIASPTRTTLDKLASGLGVETAELF